MNDDLAVAVPDNHIVFTVVTLWKPFRLDRTLVGRMLASLAESYARNYTFVDFQISSACAYDINNHKHLVCFAFLFRKDKSIGGSPPISIRPQF